MSKPAAFAAVAEPTFDVMSVEHVVTLAVIVVIAVLLPALLHGTRATANGATIRSVVCYALAFVLVSAQVGGDLIELQLGRYSIQRSLPLHLCDLGAFVSAVALVLAARPPHRDSLGRCQPLFEAAYFWGLGGTTQALLTPVIDDRFPHPIFITFFVAHGAILWAVAAMFGMGFRPARGFVLRTWLISNALAAGVISANWMLGANYMFLCGPPENPSLYDHLGPWPWSLISLEILGLLILFVLALPFVRFRKSVAEV
ncbi:MAG: TIGR02206 family membrane protein [Phycisphaerae bacterium]